MRLSTGYPLDKNMRATSGVEQRLESTTGSIIDRVNTILGYDISAALIDRYAKLAVRSASLKRLESGELFAEIEGMPGVWARGTSEKEVLEQLEEVIEDWTALKIQDGDKDLPIINGINLNVL